MTNERDVQVRHGAPHRGLLAVMVGALLALGERALPQDSGAVPIRVALAERATDFPSIPNASVDEAAVRACRASLRDDSAVARAAVTFTRVLPSAPWRAVQFGHLPRGISPTTEAAISVVEEDDPFIYWRAPLHGPALLHELVHAWQSALPDDDFAALIERLGERDAHAGFSADVVNAATSSAVHALVLAAPHADARLTRLVDRASTVSASDAGALERRSSALIALMRGNDWKDARLALSRGLSARAADAGTPRDWAAWLRVLILTEAQAYDAQARCSAGDPPETWLPERPAQSPPRVATVSSVWRDRGADERPR
ncbi:MAG TPA: hypothetical protein VGT98_08305 [Candidatus Elarobacter sp.]|nr:hypothetical protein [Candidatus Elarobacter sp.]